LKMILIIIIACSGTCLSAMVQKYKKRDIFLDTITNHSDHRIAIYVGWPEVVHSYIDQGRTCQFEPSWIPEFDPPKDIRSKWYVKHIRFEEREKKSASLSIIVFRYKGVSLGKEFDEGLELDGEKQYDRITLDKIDAVGIDVTLKGPGLQLESLALRPYRYLCNVVRNNYE